MKSRTPCTLLGARLQGPPDPRPQLLRAPLVAHGRPDPRTGTLSLRHPAVRHASGTLGLPSPSPSRGPSPRHGTSHRERPYRGLSREPTVAPTCLYRGCGVERCANTFVSVARGAGWGAGSDAGRPCGWSGGTTGDGGICTAGAGVGSLPLLLLSCFLSLEAHVPSTAPLTMSISSTATDLPVQDGPHQHS